MNKHLFIPFVAWLMLAATLLPMPALAAAKADDPAASTRAFYAWFIGHDTDAGYPLASPDIYRYVAKATVDRLREDYRRSGPPGGVDYFLKVQDYDTRDWLAHIATQPAILLGTVTVVPVTLGSTDKVGVLVFLRRSGGSWKIIKVDDTRSYP